METSWATGAWADNVWVVGAWANYVIAYHHDGVFMIVDLGGGLVYLKSVS